MIKSRVLMFFGLTMLILFSLSARSLALFTSETISPGNHIASGTMYIGGETGERGILSQSINLENLIPGAEPQSVKLKVKNLGSMTAYIKGLSACISESDDKFISNAIQAKCLSENKVELYQGSLLALDGNVIPLDHTVALEAESSTELQLQLQLDERAGNWYKEKKVELSFSVYAFQNEDQNVDQRTKLATKDSAQACLNVANLGDVVLVPAGDYETLLVKPGVTVKARDVVFDTTVQGITVQPSSQGKEQDTVAVEELADQPTSVQGFTMKDGGVQVQSGKSCKIADNIFLSQKIAVNVDNGKAIVTRNDLEGFSEEEGVRSNQLNNKESSNVFQGQVEAKYNLGVDLNPEKDAL